MSRAVSDSGSRATGRLSESARAINSSAVRSRSFQAAAAAQPSSIMISSGAARWPAASGGCHCGPAAAMMTSAASVSRNNVSHHGVRDGVSSLGAISNKSRVGGKSMRRGRGGTSRNSHHSAGRLIRPSSTSGCAKASGNEGDHAAPPLSMGTWRALIAGACALAPMRAWIANSSSVGPRSVRCTVKLQPNCSHSARSAAR